MSVRLVEPVEEVEVTRRTASTGVDKISTLTIRQVDKIGIKEKEEVK